MRSRDAVTSFVESRAAYRAIQWYCHPYLAVVQDIYMKVVKL